MRLADVYGQHDSGAQTQRPTVGALNPYQKSALTVALRHLEKALDTIAVLLAGGRQSLLCRVAGDLTGDQRALIEERLALLRKELAVVASKFDIEAEEVSWRQTACALLSSAWEGLEDVRSKKLRRYGAVDNRLQDSLDPHIERLIRLVLELTHLANEAPAAQGECICGEAD